MEKYIIQFFEPIPLSDRSHVRGWAQYWAEMLDAKIYNRSGDFTDIRPDDICYIDHGANFMGSVTSFGGITDIKARRLANLSVSGAKLISLDMPMPNYIYRLGRWQQQPACSKLLTDDVIVRLDEMMVKDEYVSWKDFKKSWLSVGDSHSLAYARKGAAIIRNNGKTLHGFINDRAILDMIDENFYPELEGITFTFGSIDIRHHLMRRDDPKAETIDLVKSYAKTLKEVGEKYKIKVEASMPVPIEHEARKISYGGLYKKTPFFGSLEQRRELTDIFGNTLRTEGIEVVSPPVEWYSMDPEQYAKTFMELNSSVHIAPKFYRSNNWGSSMGLQQLYD